MEAGAPGEGARGAAPPVSEFSIEKRAEELCSSANDHNPLAYSSPARVRAIAIQLARETAEAIATRLDRLARSADTDDVAIVQHCADVAHWFVMPQPPTTREQRLERFARRIPCACGVGPSPGLHSFSCMWDLAQRALAP